MNSTYLISKESLIIKLIDEFKEYDYVSVLGADCKNENYRVTTRQKQISKGLSERGFVIKLYKDDYYHEYSFDEITEENFDSLVKDIKDSFAKTSFKKAKTSVLADEALEEDFERLSKENYTDEEIMTYLEEMVKEMSGEEIVNAISLYRTMEVNKIFYSRNRRLSQTYTYANLYALAVSRNEETMQEAFKTLDAVDPSTLFNKRLVLANAAKDTAIMLLKAKAVTPGVYDVITSPSISGLIAHEAFGHGVEMDMFVKNRALAKDYLGKQVASEIVSMHDGAASAINVASYFFDDDGVLASDTLIIDKGILVSGISDALSASVLKTKPTGNSRRENFAHKAYSRMTNTFFSPGKDKLEEMIKSIEYGYILYDTNNGMEDPKNWGIQCTASYGLEIKNGQLTGEVIAPVIMTGYVPDVLKSISMISDDFELSGSGSCGKGHKEWVRVSDGGPYMKVRVKLG